jgi:hypothetical protein
MCNRVDLKKADTSQPAPGAAVDRTAHRLIATERHGSRPTASCRARLAHRGGAGKCASLTGQVEAAAHGADQMAEKRIGGRLFLGSAGG